MSKDPAFLFYSKDWIEGTAELMPEEKGVYIDLLCFQHQRQSLPIEINRLSKMVGLSEKDFKKIWAIISKNFDEIDGRLFNKKLMVVTEQRKAKGHKNKITGIFASMLRLGKFSVKEYKHLKDNFNVEDFIKYDSNSLTERLTEWLTSCLKSIGNENEDISILDINKEEEEENKKTWKNDFEIYLKNLRNAWKEVLTPEYLKERQSYHPNLDIIKTIEKSCKDFWATEEGWENKKAKKKTITINWKSTFNNILDEKRNQVYKQKEVKPFNKMNHTELKNYGFGKGYFVPDCEATEDYKLWAMEWGQYGQ